MRSGLDAVAEREYRREWTGDPRAGLVGDEAEPGRTDAAVSPAVHTAARACEVEIIKHEGLAMNYVPAVSKEHLGYLFDVDVEAHARRRYRALPSPHLRTSRIGVKDDSNPSLVSSFALHGGPPPAQGRGWPEGDERVGQS